MQQMLLVCKTPVQSEHGAPPCPARQRCSSLLAAVLPAAAQPCTCECIAGCTERLMTIPTHPPPPIFPPFSPPKWQQLCFQPHSATQRTSSHTQPPHLCGGGGPQLCPPQPTVSTPCTHTDKYFIAQKDSFFFFFLFFLVYIIIFFPPAPLSPHISFWLSHFCRLCCDLGRGDTGRDVPLPPPPKKRWEKEKCG